MINNHFDHLKDLVVDDTRERKPRRTKKDELLELTGYTLRLYSNGEVYPSKQLAELLELEYVGKGNEEEANGLDLVDTSEWPSFKDQPRTIFIGVVPKSKPKVDLFAACRYDKEGNPITSVLTQGTRSETLLLLARSMDWLKDEKHIDLEVHTSVEVKTKDGISYIPKVVERGDDKGEKTYERRENEVFYPLSPIVSDQTEQTGTERTVQNETILNTNN